MYRELTVNSDIDLVKLLWDMFPDSSESEIEELLDCGWVKVGDEVAHWGWQVYRGESVIIDTPVGDPANEVTSKMSESNEIIQPEMTTDSDNQHVSRLLAAFRDRLIDLTRKNRLINYRHSESSNTHIRIIDCGLNDLVSEIKLGRQLEFTDLPHPTRPLDDEDSSEFRAAYESAALSDPEFLEQVQRLNLEGLTSRKPTLKLKDC